MQAHGKSELTQLAKTLRRQFLCTSLRVGNAI